VFARKTKQPGNSRVLETLQKLIPLFFLFIVGLLASCAQDSIFYEVANEVAPKDPLISGGPSQIVEHGTKLYVARKHVYTYDFPARTRGTSTAISNNNFGKILDLEEPADIEALTSYAETFSNPVPEGVIVKNLFDDVEYIWSTVRAVQQWNRIHRWGRVTPDPVQHYGGNAIDIASDGTELFVLTMDNWDAYSMKLWHGTDGMSWTGPVTSDPSHLENIYGGGDTLFAGVFTGTNYRDYRVLYYDSGNLVPCTDGTNPISGRLGGAAKKGSDYYVAAGNTLYYGSSPTSLTAVTTPAAFPGAIRGVIDIDPTVLGGKIAVITSNGYLYEGSGGIFDQIGNFGGKFTGALEVYKESGGPKLLLIGTSSDSTYYTYGYREVFINSGFGDLSPGFNEPGGSNSSIVNQPRYRSTIGRRVVNSIRQSPVDNILFASTQTKGLWSYRGETWNAEE
jgi:hypothetical protein